MCKLLIILASIIYHLDSDYLSLNNDIDLNRGHKYCMSSHCAPDVNVTIQYDIIHYTLEDWYTLPHTDAPCHFTYWHWKIILWSLFGLRNAEILQCNITRQGFMCGGRRRWWSGECNLYNTSVYWQLLWKQVSLSTFVLLLWPQCYAGGHTVHYTIDDNNNEKQHESVKSFIEVPSNLKCFFITISYNVERCYS